MVLNLERKVELTNFNSVVRVIDGPADVLGKTYVAEFSNANDTLVLRDVLGNIRHISNRIVKAYEIGKTGNMVFISENNIKNTTFVYILQQ